MNKITSRNTIYLVLVFMLLTFTSCRTKDAPTEPQNTITDEGNTTSNTGTKNTAKNKKQPELAVKFANALCDEDYQVILDMLYLPENSVVAPTDIQTFLKRSNLTSFIGSDCIEVTDAKENDTALTFTIQSNNDTCEINFLMNENKNMVLQMENAYIEKELIAPGETSIRINGIALDTFDKTKYVTEYEDDEPGIVVYQTICPAADFTAHVSTAIDDYDITIPYVADNEPQWLVNTELDEQTVTNICDNTKTIFNNLIQAMHDGKTTLTDLQNFFVTDVDANLVNNIVRWHQTANMQPDTTVSILEPSDKQGEPCYIITNDTIKLYLRYETHWVDESTQNEKTSRGYTQFTMTLEQGTWRIKDTNIHENGFFINPFTHDW